MKLTGLVKEGYPRGITAAIVERLAQLPEFLIRPGKSFAACFKAEDPFPNAVAFAAVMFSVGIAASAAVGIGSSIELSHVTILTVGSVALWVTYAIFLHGFAFVFGARRGIKLTITAYLYVMGFLQPVFVLVVYAITWIVPGAVTYGHIRRGLGGSGAAEVIASGNFLSFDANALYRVVSGFLILFYFAIGLAKAHHISVFRSFAASGASAVFFLISLVVIHVASRSFGLRLFE